jgi:hypothetical protein
VSTSGESAGERRAAGSVVPGRRRRTSRVERLFVRVIAIGGIIGIGVALGAILASNKVQGWIVGLVVAVVSLVLAGALRSTRPMRPI